MAAEAPAGPPKLTALAARFRWALPPRVGEVSQALESALYFRDFLALVREHLPDLEREILDCGDERRQVWGFAEEFSRRFFPIAEQEDYSELLRCIPVLLGGLDWDFLHDPDETRPGLRLLHAISEFPTDHPDIGQPGVRVAWLEFCTGLVPQELLERIPAGGYPRKELHRLLDGTSYQGAAMAADILWKDTGYVFLDVSLDDGWDPPEWSRKEVDVLAEEWKAARRIDEAVGALADRIEEDPHTRFRQLLDFIEERRLQRDGRQLGLAL